MYKNSGLPEIVRNPSEITRKYLDIWFTGRSSFGQALSLLGWPVTADDRPLLVWNKKDGLRLDLKVEERVMYGRTIFHYVKIDNDYLLQIDPKKIWSINNIIGTLQALWSQSKLLINYQRTYDLAKTYVESIPLHVTGDRVTVEKTLSAVVWKMVIAVDYIGEFVYAALTNRLTAQQKAALIQRLHMRTRKVDWYTQSILAWGELQEKKISEQVFLSDYGYRAGDDYELTSPRYYEILKLPKPIITTLKIDEMKINNLEDLYVGLQYLRSEAKRRSLIWIAGIREFI